MGHVKYRFFHVNHFLNVEVPITLTYCINEGIMDLYIGREYIDL